MPKDTTTNQNQPTPAGSPGAGKDKPQKPGAKQVDDPIIVKGGSVSLSFDRPNFKDLRGRPQTTRTRSFLTS